MGPRFQKAKFCRHVVSVLLGVVWIGMGDPAGAQENWTRFHGPNGTGLAAQAELPTDISDENYQWKIKLAGIGSSSPVVWGDKIFITGCDPDTATLTLQCLDTVTGHENWSKTFPSLPYRVHRRNNFASSTPAVDKDHVYIAFANPEHTMLVAVDHAGEQKWERDFGKWVSQHGFGASPIVCDDKVVFFNSQQAQKLRPGQEPGESRVIALLAKDGSDVWNTSLTATRCCYSIPTLFRDASGKEHLVSCNTGDGFFSLDPETGEKNWSTLPFRMRTVASTLVAGGLIIGSTGSGGGGNYLVAIRPDETGAKPPVKAYEVKQANYVSSPIAVDDKLFMFTDKGIGRCVDLQTGKLIWEKRISSGFSSSPVATAKHIYVTDEDGNLYVIAVSDEYNRVAYHPLGESTRSTPAIFDNRLYLRTDSHLICVGNKTN
jgi:outer membrane protein assembly factor BamB